MPTARGAAGEELTVTLLTMGPGDEVWERFGHNALWIHDASTGEDVVYNWGLFSFAEEGFLLRFLQGDMQYWMDGLSLEGTLHEYRSRNRSIWAQELSLTPQQRAELQEFVEWNRLPQNRYYRYDYFRDNCSTRVRDALDLVLDGTLRRAGVEMGRGSYRWHARRLVQMDLVIDRGMHILMGPRGDAFLSRWEEAFVPMELMELVATVSVPDENGGEVPLVRETRTLFEAERPPEPRESPGFHLSFLAVGLTLAFLFPLLAGPGARTRRGVRVAHASLGAGWCLFCAFFGSIQALAWLWTDHVFMHANENLLQLSPLSLLLLPAVVAAAGWHRWMGVARGLALVLVVGSAAGAVLKLIPGFVQVNMDVIALALPAHAGLAASLFRAEDPRRGGF